MLLLVLPLIFISCFLLLFIVVKVWQWIDPLPKFDRLSAALWYRVPPKWLVRIQLLFDSEAQQQQIHRQLSLWLLALLVSLGLSVVSEQYLWLLAVALLMLFQISRNQSRFKQKQRAIVKELPDFCDLLAMMIAAGIPLIPAMARVASACEGGRLANEMYRVNQHLRQGMPFSEALQRMAQFYRLALLTEWAGLLIQGHQQGSSLVTTLRFHSLQMRQQLLNEAEKRAQEAPVKLLFPLMTCFFPVNFLVILGPIVLQISQGGF